MSTWFELGLAACLVIMLVVLYLIAHGIVELNQRLHALTQMLGNEPAGEQTQRRLEEIRQQLANMKVDVSGIYRRVALAVRTPEEIQRDWDNA